MTDISVIKMIISVAVWRIYPSWVNDKLRAWDGLGHSGMFWARLSRDDFCSKLEIISFLSRVMSVSKSFFVCRAFERFGAKCSSSGAFGFDTVLGLYLKTPLRHRGLFCELWLRPQVFFMKISFLFSKAEPVSLAWQLGRSQVWAKHYGDGTSKTRMKTRLPRIGEIRAQKDHRSSSRLVRVVCGDPWSRREKKKQKKQGSQRVIVRRLNPSSSTNQWVLRSLFPRPDVATVLHFAIFVDVDVHELQDGQAAARGQRRKAVIRDISGVDHWHNEIECTDLVHWTEALHRFSSRDAIIVVGFVLVKHFDGDFTPDQKKRDHF